MMKQNQHPNVIYILADDMGLGKTLQTIAFLLSEMQEAPEDANRRSLIVAPASLVYNWESECARFAPELQTRLVAGTQEQRKEMIQNAGMQDIFDYLVRFAPPRYRTVSGSPVLLRDH